MVFEPCIILKPEMVKVAKTARIDSFCKVEGGQGVTIGEHVHIASFSHLNAGGGTVIFEDHSGCSSHCVIGGGSPDWSYLYVSAADPPHLLHIRRYVTRVCAYAILFMGVVVVPGVTIGEGAVVLPGSLVKGDVDPWSIVEGNPARRVGERKITTREASIEGSHSIGLSECNELHREVLLPDGRAAENPRRRWTLTSSGTWVR